MKSVLLTEDQKQVLAQRLSASLTEEGELICTSQKFRSQLQNKEHCKDKCHQIILAALKPVKNRKKTHLPASVREARLRDKKSKSLTKMFRRKIGHNDL